MFINWNLSYLDLCKDLIPCDSFMPFSAVPIVVVVAGLVEVHSSFTIYFADLFFRCIMWLVGARIYFLHCVWNSENWMTMMMIMLTHNPSLASCELWCGAVRWMCEPPLVVHKLLQLVWDYNIACSNSNIFVLICRLGEFQLKCWM